MSGFSEGLVIDSYEDPYLRKRIYDGWMHIKHFASLELMV